MSIPATELAAMQAAAITAMDQTCTIARKSPVRDAYGSQSDNFTTLSQTTYGTGPVPCSVTQPSSQVMQNYDYLIGTLSAWVVRLPATSTIARDDQVTLTSSGQKLRVQTVLDLRSRLIDMHVLVSEIR